MAWDTAERIILVLTGYSMFGVAFAIAFLSFGAGRMDDSARTMPMRVKLLVFPGCAALWPVLAVKWATGWKA